MKGLPKELLVIDVETTGLSDLDDRIVEIAAVHLAGPNLEERSWFRTLVRADCRISSRATAVHGLTDEDLRAAPPEREAIDALTRFAPGRGIVTGHNVGFDVAFLRAAYGRTEVMYPFDYHTLDVWSLAFFILGSEGVRLPKYNLDDLCGLYGIRRPSVHNALDDVRATAEVLRYLSAAVRGADISALGQFNLFESET